MDIDLDLYRHEVRVSTSPLAHGTASLVRLSAIDISLDSFSRYLLLWVISNPVKNVSNLLPGIDPHANLADIQPL